MDSPSGKPQRTLLLDGDTLIFEAAASCEYETQWDGGWLWTLHADLDQAIAKLQDSIAEIIDQLQPTRTVLALTDTENWRKGVMSTYKFNRKKTRKPIVYKPLRELCHETMEVYQRPGLEGDDILGILATHPTLIPGEKILVSIDKDMKTIPGLHLNYQKARASGEWEAHLITERSADRHHLYQTLTGDATDGYPGCPGVGPVSAEKVLGDDPTWDKVVGAYKKAGLGEGVALQNARVARILRYTDYDFKTKEVKLWQP